MAGGSMSGGSPVLFRYNDSGGRVSPESIAAKFAALAREAPFPADARRDWTERPELTLEQWRAFTGNDRNSLVTRLERDMLGAHALELRFNFTRPPAKQEAGGTMPEEVIGELWNVRTVPVEGLERDYFGGPFPPAGRALPGPFQSLVKGPNRLLLWPVKILGQGYPLKTGEEPEVPEFLLRPRNL
jgi:hypothetical protein